MGSCCGCDLLVDHDLEPLRVRRDRSARQYEANRVPIPFQASEAKGTILAGAVLQNPAWSRLRTIKSVEAR